MINIYKITIDNKNYYVTKSLRKHKKYDVYLNGDYLLSFGDRRYQHYHDRIGEFNYLDHKDNERRDNYLKRAYGIGNVNNPKSSNYWSINYLW